MKKVSAALIAITSLIHIGCNAPLGSSDAQLEPAPIARVSASLSTSGVVVPAGFEVVDIAELGKESQISGIALRNSDELYVSDVAQLALGDEAIHRVDLVTNTVTTPVYGLPLGSPGRMLFGDGRPPLGDDLIVADWNSVETGPCCDGRVYRFDIDSASGGTAPYHVLSAGSPGTTVGDPFGLALGPGGEFAASLYVMDFQGASSQEPRLFEISTGGVVTHTASDPAQWTTAQSPGAIEFGMGSGFYGLYVADRHTGNPTVWNVSGTGAITPFVQGAPFATIASLRFATGGAFGSDMYVLDASTKQLRVVDSSGSTTIFAKGFDDTTAFSDMVFAPDASRLYVGMGNKIIAIQPAAPSCDPS